MHLLAFMHAEVQFYSRFRGLFGSRFWVLISPALTGTNLGGFMGAPNGKAFQISVFDMLRVQDGQVVEHWGAPDRFALMAQLGMLPNGKA